MCVFQRRRRQHIVQCFRLQAGMSVHPSPCLCVFADLRYLLLDCTRLAPYRYIALCKSV